MNSPASKCWRARSTLTSVEACFCVDKRLEFLKPEDVAAYGKVYVMGEDELRALIRKHADENNLWASKKLINIGKGLGDDRPQPLWAV